jgi:hypothetical protein
MCHFLSLLIMIMRILVQALRVKNHEIKVLQTVCREMEEDMQAAEARHRTTADALREARDVPTNGIMTAVFSQASASASSSLSSSSSSSSHPRAACSSFGFWCNPQETTRLRGGVAAAEGEVAKLRATVVELEEARQQEAARYQETLDEFNEEIAAMDEEIEAMVYRQQSQVGEFRGGVATIIQL